MDNPYILIRGVYIKKDHITSFKVKKEYDTMHCIYSDNRHGREDYKLSSYQLYMLIAGEGVTYKPKKMTGSRTELDNANKDMQDEILEIAKSIGIPVTKFEQLEIN